MEGNALLRLSDWMEGVLACTVRVTALSRLAGGGIQENWLVASEVNGRPRDFVLRKDAQATIEASHSRKNEYALIKAAQDAGVTVPEPIGFCEDAAVMGSPFALMAKVPGIGLGPKVVKELSDTERPALTERLARELARIHTIRPPSKQLGFLGKPPADFAMAEVALLRDWLDRLNLARPGLEWALRWCELHVPRPRETVLIHRDFRTGNYMTNQGQLSAILDWEFACWGDPMFDIGWFMAECWRFSRPDLEAGGVGERAAFYAAYEDESGRKVNDPAVRAYEVLSHCRWAVIALQQGERHTSGREPSLEHALTGKIAEELELTALRMTRPERWRLRHDGGLGA
jgi:aminoglycoside phosphotransferase (APT) family kinase protein